MSFHKNRSFLPAVRLHAERLEDRTTPTTIYPIADSYDQFSVLVSFQPNDTATRASLESAPWTNSLTHLGFGIYRVGLEANVSVDAAITILSAAPGIANVERDLHFTIQQTPNDPSYTRTWGMNTIGAPTGWNTATGTGRTIVAVIDSGVDYTHADLVNNIWINQGEIPASIRATIIDTDGDGRISFVDLNSSLNAGRVQDHNANGRIDAGDLLRSTAQGGWQDGLDNVANGKVDDLFGWNYVSNTNNPMDDNSHGTHVAGTIGAVGNNGIGVSGVAWTTTIMPLKFLAANGSGSISAAVSAINYAVANGATILNNSWGGGGFSFMLQTAIANARAAGVIFVAAAGNASSNNAVVRTYPASYNSDNVVSVAATDSADRLASFSNYGTNVTLAAPGVGIYSTVPNGGYASYSGTSMAAPHVAGALAVLWDANPTWTYSQVIAQLKSSVDLLPQLAGKTSTSGRLNLPKMLATTTPTPVTGSGAKVVAASFNPTTTNTLDRASVTFDRGINESTFTASDVTLSGPAGNIAVVGVTPVPGTNNTQFDITFAVQTRAGTYTLAVGPNILDTSGVAMNQDGDAVNGESTADRFTASTTLVAPSLTTYSNNKSVPIRDYSVSISSITVPATTAKISDLNVKVRLTHTWVSDLYILLVAPDGRAFTLFNRRGGSGDNLTNTTFDDQASMAIAHGQAPFNGTFRPESSLASLNGSSPAGVWKLAVYDLARGDIGTLTNFTLEITTAAMESSTRSLGFSDPLPSASNPFSGVSNSASNSGSNPSTRSSSTPGTNRLASTVAAPALFAVVVARNLAWSTSWAAPPLTPSSTSSSVPLNVEANFWTVRNNYARSGNASWVAPFVVAEPPHDNDLV